MQLKWILSHIRGYLELGMLREAEQEFRQIPAEDAQSFEVRFLKALLLQEKKDWPRLADVSEVLVREKPDDPSGWIMWAYAIRRSISIEAAKKILQQAALTHPKEATIQFNLGCYACQQGELDQARNYVTCAIALDAHFKDAAASDPDLAPLRESGMSF